VKNAVLSHGADEEDSNRQNGDHCRQNLQGRQACRSPDGTTDEVPITLLLRADKILD